MTRSKTPERISHQLLRVLQLIDLSAQWRRPFTAHKLHREWQQEFGATVHLRTIARDCQLLCHVGLIHVVGTVSPSRNGAGRETPLYRQNMLATVSLQRAGLVVIER